MDNTHVFHSFSPEDTKRIGEQFAQRIKEMSFGPVVLCLSGDLGSGKTTFTQGFAKGLGLEGRLLSPTFIILRSYETPRVHNFYHIDLYRITNEQDMDILGIQEIFTDPAAVIVIEWPEKIAKIVPEKRWELTFTSEGDDKRAVTVVSKGFAKNDMEVTI
jgi:tRNA threonylcarbamoyladenosine biosynthesis protein TsaE